MWLWDSEPLRRALVKADLGAALAIIRSATGLSQLEFANLLGWSQSGVARAESGQRDTLYDLRRLFEMIDALDMPRAALIPLLLGGPDGEQFEREETYEMSLSRRELGGTLIGIAAAAGLSQVEIPTRIGSAHMRYFHASVERLYAEDQRVGGGVLARDGLRLYHRARRMLDEADYSEETARQLMRAAGELAVCVGWLSYDAHDQVLARALYSEARLLADQSGDYGLAVHAMGNNVLQLVDAALAGSYPGRAREAILLSRRAVELARPDPSSQLHALLAAREALAHAAVGDGNGFNAAMTRAWREMDREPTNDDRPGRPGWLGFVNRSEIAVHEARGRLCLGDVDAAVRLYRSSLDAELSPRNAGIYRARLAAALAASGDVSDAVAEGMTVLPAIDKGGVPSPRTIHILRLVRSVAARDCRGEEFCTQYDLATMVSA